MKKIFLLITFVTISTFDQATSQRTWDTLRGFIRADRTSFCMCGLGFEIDSAYRSVPENRYIELSNSFGDINLYEYYNLHVEIKGYWFICVEGCAGFDVYSIQVVVQGRVRHDIPSTCMCGTVLELDPEHRPSPGFTYIILNEDLNSYDGLHVEVRGYPDTCAGRCKVVNVEKINIRQTSVNENTINASTTYTLYQNYPNPFNPSTTISWQVQVGSWVTLKVYDVLGREIATLVDEKREAGSYEVV